MVLAGTTITTTPLITAQVGPIMGQRGNMELQGQLQKNTNRLFSKEKWLKKTGRKAAFKIKLVNAWGGAKTLLEAADSVSVNNYEP